MRGETDAPASVGPTLQRRRSGSSSKAGVDGDPRTRTWTVPEHGAARRAGRGTGRAFFMRRSVALTRGDRRRDSATVGEVPKRSNGADCKSAGYAFGGSNPPLSTTAGDTKSVDTKSGDTTSGDFRDANLQTQDSEGPQAATLPRRDVSGEVIRGARAGIAQLARARAFQARGRGFESRFPLHALACPRSSGGRARPW